MKQVMTKAAHIDKYVAGKKLKMEAPSTFENEAKTYIEVNKEDLRRLMMSSEYGYRIHIEIGAAVVYIDLLTRYKK